jgi:hypothetical protein
MYDDVSLEGMEWFQDILSFTLIKYFPRKGNSPDIPSSTKLVWGFKDNLPLALSKVRDLAFEALRDYEDFEEFRWGYLVVLPSHSAGSINMPCEYLCAELARAYPGQLVHLKQALRRTTTVERSATAPAGQRPTYIEHKNSIVYDGPKVSSGAKIIMVDDVLTRGETSNACRDILKRATGCKDVRGFFVAKTQSS